MVFFLVSNSNSRKIYRDDKFFTLGYCLLVAPQILTFTFGEEPANWGDLVSVTCSVIKGDNPVLISWAFNGEPIENDQTTDVTIGSTNRKNSVLSIEAVAARHAGEYTCSASNQAGATSHSARLLVNGTTRGLFSGLIEKSSTTFFSSSFFFPESPSVRIPLPPFFTHQISDCSFLFTGSV